MKQFFPILILVCSAWPRADAQPRDAATAPASPQAATGAKPDAAISPDQENARKAKTIVDQGIEALGGQIYLTIHDREQQGRGYSFHHGRESGGGVFWSFA